MRRTPLFHRCTSSGSTLLAVFLFVECAVAQTRQEQAEAEVLKQFSKPIPGVDWDELSVHYVEMMDRMFERNGWTDESDRYARNVASKVAAIPPWDVAARFQALSDEVADRYDLTPGQAAQFQGAVMREAMGMMVRHGPAMWEQAKEALQARTDGEPYTAEKIAEWARNGEPIFREFEASVERIAGELEKSLSEEKKEVLARDIAGFHKRQKAVEGMTERWAKGLWQPDEWGLENDPIQNKAKAMGIPTPAPAAAPVAKARPVAPLVEPVVAGPPIPDHWVEFDPSTWIAFVMEFGKKYRLDSGQMDTAWSIHAELVERAKRYRDLRSKELEAIPPGLRLSHELYKPICELFGEFRDRLESIPTSAQRDAVKK